MSGRSYVISGLLRYGAIVVGSVLLAGCGWPAGNASAVSRSNESSVLRVASTTSTRDSGLFDILLPVFEEANHCRVDLIAVGTGAALKLGEDGDVDAIVCHARSAEEAFMAAGHGVRHEPVMHNFFIIAGPAGDPAGVRGGDAVGALKKIAAGRHRFISRGDDSGTHKRELALWVKADGRPDWDEYLEIGQGMGPCLVMADELNAYVLTDGGTWLNQSAGFRVVGLVTDTDELRNLYAAIVVNPGKHPAVNSKLANTFVDFLISAEAQQLIAAFQVNQHNLFHPDRLGGDGRVIREGFVEALKLLVQLDPKVIDAAVRSLWISTLAVTVASIVGIAIGLFLARKKFVGNRIIVLLFRVGMSVPTVLIGLLVFGVLSRRGTLGEAELLYTPWAIVIGEFFLALPIVTTLTHGSIMRLDRRVFETARTLGAGIAQRSATYLSEARLAIALAVLTAFARCITELGIALMVGGNILGRTRTLTTATALERSKGEFARGVAMSLILLGVAMAVTLVISWFSRSGEETS